MTVGFFSPLPPARTGVADYAAALLTELRRHGRVEVAPARCDRALYHLGNNGLHAEIYRRAMASPGVVVLHDAVLNHFFLGQLSETQYVDEFVYNYGEWNRGLGRDLWRARAGSAADERYFRYPMLKRAAERARAVVVHNPAAAAAVREHAGGARVVEIPHLFAPPQLPDEARVLRYPAAGESSGIAVRMMGIGKPVLLTEGSESAPFPEDACVRIAAGPAERDSLRHHMVLLTSMADVARTIGLRGAGHIAAHHRVEPIGKRFWDLLCESCI